MSFSRILKYSKYATIASATLGGVAVLHNNDWDLSTLGLVRFGRTAFTVASISLDYKLSLRGVDRSSETQPLWSKVHKRSAERLLDLCSTNGGVFIKVGQHIGALEYLVPPEYSETLKVLHSRAPRSSFEDVQKVIETDLKASMEDLFSEFNKEPIGTASLAQVHKAVLKETGEIVAVKVQHPRVKKHSLVDMTTMDMLVRIVAKVFPDFSLLWLADNMRRNIPLELDFIHEGKNSERVQQMLFNLKWLKIPTINWNLCSTRVLTMEFVDGGEITDKSYFVKHKINVRETSDRLATLYSEMIFKHGFVHCDPHPGNILIRNNSNGPEIVLLDHGLYIDLPESFRHNYSSMWLSIINADVPNIKKYGERLGAGDLFPLLACMLTSKPWESLAAGLTKTGNKIDPNAEKEQLKQYVVEYFPQIANVLGRVNHELLLILKTNDLLRGIEASLGTKAERRSLLKMSRYCVKTAYEQRLKKCGGFFCRIKLYFGREWTLFKLTAHQLYLWFYSVSHGSIYL